MNTMKRLTACWLRPSLSNPCSTNDIVWAFFTCKPNTVTVRYELCPYNYHISFTDYHIKSPIYICLSFKLFKIWKIGNFNKLSYPVILIKFRFVTFTRCSQKTLLDKTDRLGQPYYHSYPFDSYSFQFHINMIRFFNVPNHKLILNVGLPKM